MDSPSFSNAYVLTCLFFDNKRNIKSRNVGMTFSLHEAEQHKGQGIENDFESFPVSPDWQEHAATTDLVFAMRTFCDMVKELQQDAEFQ